jgi:neopullulanase
MRKAAREDHPRGLTDRARSLLLETHEPLDGVFMRFYDHARRTLRGCLVVALAALPLTGSADETSAVIERIDPPSWWIGFKEPTVELLVHGKEVGSLVPELTYPGVEIASFGSLKNNNYLSITLKIAPTATPGSVPIVFRRDGVEVARQAYELAARRTGSRDRRGFDGSDVIYLAMADRFANGDPGNDHAAGTRDHVDRHEGGARHGGDLAGLTAHVDFLERMGYTQLWLTPVLENDMPSYSYHGYAITDHYRVDPRYGTNADLRTLAARAREHHIGLIADIVVNHIGSAHWWMRDLPEPDWLSGDGLRTPTNHMHHSIPDPHAAPSDRATFIDGWFSTDMPDLHPMNPHLGNYLVQNALWWIEYADLDGLRMDTYPYSDARYMADYTRRVLAEYPHLNIVGEEFDGDVGLLAYWQAGHTNPDGYASNLPSLMDFPLREGILAALAGHAADGNDFFPLYRVLTDDFLYPHPENLVVLVDNHDTDRIYTVLKHDDALWRMAMAIVATTRGIPQILYGTEVLMANTRLGNDGDRRRDFPGGFPGDTSNGFTGEGLPKTSLEAERYLARLLTWRRTATAVQSGTLTHYAPSHRQYVYFRRDANETVMVALNKNDHATTLALAPLRETLGEARVGHDVMADRDVALDDTLTLPAHSATIIDIRRTHR